jgi:Domain of unknown function (DUF1707)/2TM domain
MHRHDGPRPTQLPPPPRRPDPRLRVGDDERKLVIDQLADHHAAGRLTLEEFEDRMAAAWTARTGADLALLHQDLPSPAPTRAPARPWTGRPRLDLDPQVRTYLAVIALLWLIWLLTGAGYPWPVWPMLGWGVGVAGHQWRRPQGGAAPR